MPEKQIVHELSVTDVAYAGTKITARMSHAKEEVTLVMKDTNFNGNSTNLTTIEMRCARADAHRLARHLLTL